MQTITKEFLASIPNNGSFIETTIAINEQNIDIFIDLDDVDLEKIIELANKIISKFELYESKAREKIIQDYLEIYNNNWRDEENGHNELDEKSFGENLKLSCIGFSFASCVDFYYSENGMFGNHSLIAKSYDGENFEEATM